MKNRILISVAVLAALAGAGSVPTRGAETTPAPEGVAVVIVYDTSGSMKDSVKDRNGRPAPKIDIAARALAALAEQMKAFQAGAAQGSRRLEVGLLAFSNGGVKESVPLAPFDAERFQSATGRLPRPQGGTPLGESLRAASRMLLKSSLPRRHILVVTDGENTVGPEPASTWPEVGKAAAGKEATPGLHFVAFDVDAKVFNAVKKQGATVVGAADERQLNTQIDFILQKKILLEDEEPPAANPPPAR